MFAARRVVNCSSRECAGCTMLYGQRLRHAWRQAALAPYVWFLPAQQQRRIYITNEATRLAGGARTASAGPNRLFWRLEVIRRRAWARGLAGLAVLLLAIVAVGVALGRSAAALSAVLPLVGGVKLCVALVAACAWASGVGGLVVGAALAACGLLVGSLNPRVAVGVRSGRLTAAALPAPTWGRVPFNDLAITTYRASGALGLGRGWYPAPAGGNQPSAAALSACLAALRGGPQPLLWARVNFATTSRWAQCWPTLLAQSASHATLTRVLQSAWARQIEAVRLGEAGGVSAVAGGLGGRGIAFAVRHLGSGQPVRGVPGALSSVVLAGAEVTTVAEVRGACPAEALYALVQPALGGGGGAYGRGGAEGQAVQEWLTALQVA